MRCCRRCCRRDTSVSAVAPVEAGPEAVKGETDATPLTGDDAQASTGKLPIARPSAKDMGATASHQAVGVPFPKRPMGCKLSQQAWDKMESLFRKMDPDGSNAVTREEAKAFFKCAFGTMSVDAMFNEVDLDNSGAIDSTEFVKFWVQVRKNGYKDQDINDELDGLLEGGAWVDFKDDRDTAPAKKEQLPKRPMLCRLSKQCWEKCLEVFKKIDSDSAMAINHEKALAHFSAKNGRLSKVSVDAMFNEIDQNHHGQITPKEWMKFWVQVKAAGYKENDLMNELGELFEGNAWVDWKDGRNVA